MLLPKKALKKLTMFVSNDKNWKHTVDKGNMHGSLLTELSKAFDCLHREVLIAKLNAYGFSLLALIFIQDYLLHRKERMNIRQKLQIMQMITHHILKN